MTGDMGNVKSCGTPAPEVILLAVLKKRELTATNGLMLVYALQLNNLPIHIVVTRQVNATVCDKQMHQ